MPHIATYVRLAHRSEQTLADSFRTVAEGHAQEADIFHTCQALAAMSDAHVAAAGTGRPALPRAGRR
jgi:hypothetical protein